MQRIRPATALVVAALFTFIAIVPLRADTTISGPVTVGGEFGVSGGGKIDIATGGVSNAMLSNSSVTIAGHSVSLGGSQAIGAGDLSDYSAGASWTPIDSSGAGLTLTSDSTIYFKIGRLCIVEGRMGWPSTANTNTTSIGGLPCTAAATTDAVAGGTINYTNRGSFTSALITAGGTTFVLADSSGNVLTNANLALKEIRFTLVLITN